MPIKEQTRFNSVEISQKKLAVPAPNSLHKLISLRRALSPHSRELPPSQMNFWWLTITAPSQMTSDVTMHPFSRLHWIQTKCNIEVGKYGRYCRERSREVVFVNGAVTTCHPTWQGRISLSYGAIMHRRLNISRFGTQNIWRWHICSLLHILMWDSLYNAADGKERKSTVSLFRLKPMSMYPDSSYLWPCLQAPVGVYIILDKLTLLNWPT